MLWYEVVTIASAVFSAVFAAVLAAAFAWWGSQAANRTLRLEMFREATAAAANKHNDRTYMERVAGVFMLMQLADEQPWISRLVRKHGPYDSVVPILVEIYIRYNRIVFPKNAPGNHKGNQLDYTSKEYVMIRDWINTRAPRRITGNIALPAEHPFKMCKNKLEANENSDDYKEWMEATGGKPPYETA